MKVEFEDSLVAKSGKGVWFIVTIEKECFKVYWCNKTKHYKIEKMGE